MVKQHVFTYETSTLTPHFIVLYLLVLAPEMNRKVEGKNDKQ